MARIRKHIYIECNLLNALQKLEIEISDKYKVSFSDLLNEALSYGIPLIKIRREIGNEKLDKIYQKLLKGDRDGKEK